MASTCLGGTVTETAVSYLGEPWLDAEPLRIREDGLEACYYCGEIADTVDHVVPQSMLQKLSTLEDEDVTALLVRFNRRLTVPACFDCNVTLGNSYQDTLAKRKDELKRRLRRRFKKYLDIPEWSDRELGQLGEHLQQRVLAGIYKQQVVLRRLRY